MESRQQIEKFEHFLSLISELKQEYSIPLVILLGPKGCGKSMMLVRLKLYLEQGGFTVTPIRRRYDRGGDDMQYEEWCRRFDDVSYEYLRFFGGLRKSDVDYDYMLINISAPNGRPVCRILELPGEWCLDKNDNIRFERGRIIDNILECNRHRIWMYIFELNKWDSSTRHGYSQAVRDSNRYVLENRSRHNFNRGQYDKVILTLNKYDSIENEFHLFPPPTVEQNFEVLNKQYDHIFDTFENNHWFTRLFRKYNCKFVPFSSAFIKSDSSDDNLIRFLSPNQIPKYLCKVIIELIYGKRIKIV